MPYKDIEKRRAYHRAYSKLHPIDPEKLRQTQAKSKSKHYEKRALAWRGPAAASKRRERRYGLTPARFEQILNEQNGLCACCKLRPPVDADHDHGRKLFRSLLCRQCNIGLGMFGDDPALLRLAIEYLERPVVPLAVRIPRRIPKVRRGQDSPIAKLNDEKVRAIRAEYAAGGVSHADLAGKFGIHKNNIGRIIRHLDWSHVE